MSTDKEYPVPTLARVELVIPDDDQEAFWLEFREFVAAKGAELVGEPRQTKFTHALKELGLPTALNSILSRPPFNIGGVEVLIRWSEDRLVAESGVGYAYVRRINLALAGRGLALQGNEVIKLSDMVEQLDLPADDFWALIKNGYRRLSVLITKDKVEMQSVVNMRALEVALQKMGLKLAPLSPTRRLVDLVLDDYVVSTFEMCGIGLGTPVGQLRARSMRAVLARCCESADNVSDRIDWVRSALAGYGFALPD